MESTEGHVTTDDGCRLFFEKHGTSGPLLLVPNGIYLRDDFRRLSRHRTVVFYDVRNRGRSDAVSGAAIARGIHHDVDDLDAVRRGFHVDRVDVLAHSYMATAPVLYALKFPAQVNRIVQIGPMSPHYGKAYPPELKCEDDTLRDILTRLGRLEGERSNTEPVAFCRAFWDVLRPLYVANSADAGKVRWERCDEPNERQFMRYWTQSLLPSIKALRFTEEQLNAIGHPVLIVHGTKDRSSAYGGGRDWAASLGNARLVTVPDAAHAPWIEAPDLVFEAIETFLSGNWPSSAKRGDEYVRREDTKAAKEPLA